MIDGDTRLYGIIASPCSHVQTPQVLNAMFEARKEDAVMVPLDVPPEGLADVVAALRRMRNFGGLVVTVPHKAAFARHCDELTPRAQICGAVNVVRRSAEGRLIGDMLDGEGFVAGLKAAGYQITGQKIFLMGAGGAASAVAFALAQEKPSCLTLENRSIDKRDALASELRKQCTMVPVVTGGDPAGHDIVINATSLGLRAEDARPFDPAGLEPDALVVDVIMKPEVTALLAAARAKGCATLGGRAMLEGQVAKMYDFLTR